MNIYDATIELRNEFRVSIEEAQNLPTMYDNMRDRDICENDLWARHTILDGEKQKVTAGGVTNRTRSVGVVVVQLFTKTGRGDGEARQMADKIIAAFENKRFQDIVFKAGYPQVVGKSGGFWQINVNLPFRVENIS